MDSKQKSSTCSSLGSYATQCTTGSGLKYAVLIFSSLLGLFGIVVLPIFIFGEKSFVISRYYSSRTLHMHRVTTTAAFPTQWNSLGPISPYYDVGNQQNAQPVRQPKPYFVYEAPKNPYNNTLYINGETLSILSSISPAVYLATLIVVSCLSLVYFMFALVGEEDQVCCIPINKDTLVITRDVCGYIVMLVYFGWVFGVFVASGTTRSVAWGDHNTTDSASMTVEYKISSQIPSLVYGIIVLAMYYMHLTRKDPYWEYLFPKTSTYTELEPHIRSPWTMPVDPQKSPGEGTMFGDRLVHNSMQMQGIYIHSNQVPKSNKFPGQTQQVLMNSSGQVIKEAFSKNEKERGPVANETSIIVCAIVFLGGIANLGMSRVYLIETEAQLVIISLFVFCVLELGRTHLMSYYWYLAIHYGGAEDQQPHHAMMRKIVVFIDVVVCLLQFFVVIIWQMTMTSLLMSPDDSFRIILLMVVAVFLFLRTLSVGQALLELFGCGKTDYEGKPIDNSGTPMKSMLQNVVWKAEGYLYIFSVWLIIMALLFIPMLYESNNPEGTLLFLEKIMYDSTHGVKKFGDTIDPAKVCDNSIYTNSLMSNAMVNGNGCTREKIYQNWAIGPVHIKVFAWTRLFQLLDGYQMNSKNECNHRQCAPPSVLFCSNGFEQHWGQCKNEFLLFPSRKLTETWKTAVTKQTTP
jgi:hypothetical protein